MAGAIDDPPLEGEESLRTLLDEEDDQRQDEDLAQHGADLRFENLVGNAEAEGRKDTAGQLTNTAEHHHQEGVDDVALAEVGADVADLAQGHAAQAGDARA